MSVLKSCPTCGATTTPEARFCRQCGAPLRAAAPQDNGSEVISPLAATVRLTEEGRTTDGLADDARHPAADTRRVDQAELEAILRPAPREPKTDGPESVAESSQKTIVDETSHDATAASFNTADLNDSAGEHLRDYTTKTGPAYSVPVDDGEELTITVARPSQPFSEPSAPLRVQPIPIVGSSPLASGALPTPVIPVMPASGVSAQRQRRRRWPLVVAVCIAALLVTVAVVMLALRLRNGPAPAEAGTSSAPAAPAADEKKKLAEDKLTEAEGLLASGDLSGAIASLRAAVQYDPASVRAHRRLAEVLSESGARREAIEEFRAVTLSDPNDFTAWRALAFAQLGEGLYADAAASFNRLLALTGGAQQDPHDLLAYADALRLSGRAEEARAIYQKLSATSVAEVASAARQHLAEIAAAQTAPSPEPTRPPEAAQSQTTDATQPPPASSVPTPAQQAAPTPAPTTPAQKTALTPEEHYTRGVSLWSSNRAAALQEFRAAGNHPDANYYLGLSYVEGRDLRSLNRAALVAALQHFQIARRGRFSGQAQQYERQLGREFDRLRN